MTSPARRTSATTTSTTTHRTLRPQPRPPPTAQAHDEPRGASPVPAAEMDAAPPALTSIVGGRSTAWSPSDYLPTIASDGARKLASSAVAPLVAVARGYETIPGQDAVKEAALKLGIGPLSRAPGQQLKTVVGVHGAMLMPWYVMDMVNTAALEGARLLAPTSWQYKPAQAVIDAATGKVRKYENAIGHPAVLDIHPATPSGWLKTAPTMLFVEGLIKADSALTALLRHWGFSEADLRLDPSRPDAWARLRTMLETVPEDRRVVVISFLGAATWHANSEWDSLGRLERKALLAFDGDMGTNWNVWRQASQMKSKLETKHHSVSIIDLSQQSLPSAPDDKVGIDDFLAELGDWPDIERLITPKLPECPSPQPLYRPKDWRMNETDHVSEEYTESTDKISGNKSSRWELRARLIGWVSSVVTLRATTDEEEENGILSDDQDAITKTEFSLELEWKDPASELVRGATIKGPIKMLSTAPSEWHKVDGAVIPDAVHTHPDWPPKPEWLAAAKAFRAEDRTHTVTWDQMGWVPVEGRDPVYIIGNQVIGKEGLVPEAANPGITERELAGSSRFGVALPADADQARRDLRAVVDGYYTNAGWADQRLGSMLLAIAIRPAMPRPTRSSVYITGARRGGKSWFGGGIMSFWQARPGVWDGDRLPGSATDTEASTEIAMAKTNIWVMDDLAPSNDRRRSDDAVHRVGAAIRSKHQNTGRRRATVDMKSRATLEPRSLLVVTAENDHPISSVRDRYVPVRINKGSLGDTEWTARVEAMAKETGEQPRVTGAVIVDQARRVSESSWVSHMEVLEETFTELAADATHLIGGGMGDVRRLAYKAADLALGLNGLADLAFALGMTGLAAQLIGMQRDIFALVGEHYRAQMLTTPGQALLEAVRSILAAQQAHIISAEAPNAPPVVGENATQDNSRLGWSSGSDGALRPMGPAIGYFVTSARTKEPVILLDRVNAFGEAKRRHEDVIPPGSTASAAWGSMWDDQITSKTWKRRYSGKAPLSTIRVSAGSGYVEGIPVPLRTLLDGQSLLSLSSDDETGGEEVGEDGAV